MHFQNVSAVKNCTEPLGVLGDDWLAFPRKRRIIVHDSGLHHEDADHLRD